VTADKPANAVILPVSGLRDFREGCAFVALHQFQDDRGLAFGNHLDTPSEAQTESSPEAPRNVRVIHGVDSEEWAEIQAGPHGNLKAGTERSANRGHGGRAHPAVPYGDANIEEEPVFFTALESNSRRDKIGIVVDIRSRKEMTVLEKQCAPILAKEARFSSDNTACSTLVMGVAIVSAGDADPSGMLREQLAVRSRTKQGDQHDRQNFSHLYAR